jgi:hypothetical protein
MARVKNNIVIEGLSGNIGGQLIIKNYAYGTVISKFPDMSRVKRSEKQKARQTKFQQAVAFAKSELADPQKRVQVKARLKPGKTAFNTLISEYMRKEESDRT